MYNSFQLSALHAFQVSLLDAEHSVKNEEEGNSLLLWFLMNPGFVIFDVLTAYFAI